MLDINATILLGLFLFIALSCARNCSYYRAMIPSNYVIVLAHVIVVLYITLTN